MGRWKKILILSCAIVLYSVFFLFMWQSDDLHALQVQDMMSIVLFLAVMILINLFPIEIKGTYHVLSHTVSPAVFLLFGLYVEAIVTQLAILVALIKIRTDTWERFVCWLTMFLIISICSGTVFYTLGGVTGPFTVDHFPALIGPIAGYLLTSIILYHVLFNGLQWLLYNQKPEFLGKYFWRKLIPFCLLAPGCLLIYKLHAQIGLWLFLYAFVPVISFLVLYSLYLRLHTTNEKLQLIHHLGHEMTSKLDVKDVSDQLVQSVAQLIPYQYCYLFRVDDEEGKLKPLNILSQGKLLTARESFMKTEVNIGDGLSGQVAATGQTMLVHEEKKSGHFKHEPDGLAGQYSILSVPLIYNKKVYGVLTVSHHRRNCYCREDVTLLEILARQAAIAFKNAYDYQRTKDTSERDELTGLYNYRYFIHYLEQTLSHPDGVKQLTLILLDIDYFKQVNDSYGHLAGNKILKQIATILQDAVQRAGTVARYGGEEFAILLPNMSKQQAYQWAEALRQRIVETRMEVTADLSETPAQPVQLYITVSMGIAFYPEQATDVHSLLWQADRAMYLGAKQKGRNKVGVFREGMSL